MKNTFLIGLFSFLISTAMAQIVYVDVEASGSGVKLNDAVNDAISEAIGRVNGKSIETQSQLKFVEYSKVENGKDEYFASEDYQQAISTATKGVVKSYDVLEQSKDELGLWTVSVRVKVSKYNRSKTADRKRLAIMPLRLSDKQFFIDGEAIDKSQINRILGQNLVTQLVQSRKFTVLDREFIQETLGEKSMITDVNVPVEEMAKLGQELVADYIIVGVLENMDFKTSKIKMQSSDRVITSRNGTIEISYRIIDVATKQIKFSDFARINVSDADIRKIDDSFNLSNIDSAMTMVAADKIGKKVLNAIYPMLVVSVRNNSVTLNQGGEMIKTGDQYEVFEFGEKMIDPYTKESLGRQENYCALIEITRVTSKMSEARILNSDIDLQEIFKPKGLVCRMKQETTSSASKRIKEMKKEREARKKKRDDEW